MIRILAERKADRVQRIRCLGHAGYDTAGEDVVCAAVSVLMINTVNAIDALTEDEVVLDAVEEDAGRMEVSFPQELSHDGSLLTEALLLGLKEISKEYRQNVSFEEREV